MHTRTTPPGWVRGRKRPKPERTLGLEWALVVVAIAVAAMTALSAGHGVRRAHDYGGGVRADRGCNSSGGCGHGGGGYGYGRLELLECRWR